MSVAKVIEITAESPESADEAIKVGVRRASKTVDNITGVWVKEIKANVKDGEVTAYRVAMKVTFVLDG
jgi:dodecin